MDDQRETVVTIPDGFAIPSLHQEAAAEEENSSRWSDLPVDVLELILRRLSPVDHLRFGATCRSWRSVRTLHQTRVDLPPPQLPWLMMSGPSSTLSTGYRFEFLSRSDGRCYTISVPSRARRQHLVVGSYAHWLMTKANHKIFLINPFTRIELTLPRILMESIKPDRNLSFAVSSSPGAPYGAIVVVNLSMASLFYKRHGDMRWLKFVLDGDDRRLCQVVAIGRKFYALTHDRLRLVDIDLDRSPVAVVVNQAGSNLTNIHLFEHFFLLESDGDLLAVALTCQNHYQSPLFRVWRWNMETSSWMPMESIEDRLLFLGTSFSISVAAREHGVAGGRIYTIGRHSTGTYDPRTGRGEVFCCCRGSSRPTWVTPRLFYWEGSAGEIPWREYVEEVLKVAFLSVREDFIKCFPRVKKALEVFGCFLLSVVAVLFCTCLLVLFWASFPFIT